MNEMIDRAALAIREGMGCGATVDEQTVFCDDERIPADLRGTCDCRSMARAAIAAMREPTEEMCLAGAKASCDQHYYKSNSWERCVDPEFHEEWIKGMRYGWQAMTDQALKEG